MIQESTLGCSHFYKWHRNSLCRFRIWVWNLISLLQFDNCNTLTSIFCWREHQPNFLFGSHVLHGLLSLLLSQWIHVLCCQILIHLETALMDDTAHWYKLQTHDVSFLAMSNPSPYTQRKLLPGESPTRRLQSRSPPAPAPQT